MYNLIYRLNNNQTKKSDKGNFECYIVHGIDITLCMLFKGFRISQSTDTLEEAVRLMPEIIEKLQASNQNCDKQNL